MIAQYLKNSALLYPNKTAYSDAGRSISYSELKEEAYQVAHAVLSRGLRKKPVAVFMNKSVACISSFLGIACSGNFYSPIDTQMPEARMRKILQTLQPELVIVSRDSLEAAKGLIEKEKILLFEEICRKPYEEALVEQAIKQVIDTDVL